MSFRNAFGIYHVLETLLKSSEEPLTCVDLYDSPDVKKYADSANRVSDYLGHMYRRKLLRRFNAPKDGNSMARFAYLWKDMSVGAPVQRYAQPRLVTSVPRPLPAITPRQEVAVREDVDGLHIDLATFTITIKAK